MSDRYPDANLDLTGLPAPSVIAGLDYETILAARLSDFKARIEADGGTFNVEESELDPGVYLLQEGAEREELTLQSINDAAKAVMLPFSYKGNLDVLLSLVGVRRLTLTPAVGNTPAVMESDDDFRKRGQIALEGTAQGLTGGGYAHIALQASTLVRRVALIKRGGGVVDVVLEGRTSNAGASTTVRNADDSVTCTWIADTSVANNDGSVPASAVRAVAAALNDDWSDDETTGSQLTDIPQVMSASPVIFGVVAHFTAPAGPSIALLAQQSVAQIQAAMASMQVAGELVGLDAIIAAGRITGMVKLTIDQPTTDEVLTQYQVPFCTSIAVTGIPL